MKILFTNGRLCERGGSEMFLRDLAVAMRARGHEILVYSPRFGAVARDLEAEGFTVVSDLGVAGTPDVIHGQHHDATVAAMERFPGAPAVYVCHGSVPWQERPPRIHGDRIIRYVGVDVPCRDRLLGHGISADRVVMIHNAVDLDRFSPGSPLPCVPARALVFSNTVERSTLAALELALLSRGIALSFVGRGFGNPTARPWDVLPGHDVVFAKARCALEAMACGVAVVLGDHRGIGPPVTARAFHHLRRYNFGHTLLGQPWSVEAIHRALDQYDALDAQEVSRIVRNACGIDQQVERFEDLYREAAEFVGKA